ncbi:carboxymuconolactone decarboxylase family protein [Helicobacter himalayensis]|uniref:carboxymuconolactone decarboxylase family protein n=1 Tax=Helicobacter himalayensis TaxID=1591088 RepID=UPI003D6F6570
MKAFAVLALVFSSFGLYAKELKESVKNLKLKLSTNADKIFNKYFKGQNLELASSDNEFMSIFMNFAFGEAFETSFLDEKTKFKCIIAALVANDGLSEFENLSLAALKAGVKPEEIKEILYQATAYVGFARSSTFIKASAKVFKKLNIVLQDNRAQTTQENRLEKGLEIQVAFFGSAMRKIPKDMSEDMYFIREFLSKNCFGDYYTRAGLELKFRELLTFVLLASVGNAQPQLEAHIKGNLNIGNDRKLLIAAIRVIIPYIGYPKALNAFNSIDKITKN